MFASVYEFANPTARVKYAVLKHTRCVSGVAACSTSLQASAFVVLKSGLQHRCSLTLGMGDAPHRACCMATPALCAHQLLRLNDEQLTALCCVAAGVDAEAPSAKLWGDIVEAHIHGPVPLATCAAALVLGPALRSAGNGDGEALAGAWRRALPGCAVLFADDGNAVRQLFETLAQPQVEPAARPESQPPGAAAAAARPEPKPPGAAAGSQPVCAAKPSAAPPRASPPPPLPSLRPPPPLPPSPRLRLL